MRLVFLGSPPFATPVLARLAVSPFRPMLVVTQPARARGRGRKVEASAITELARQHDIPWLGPETVRDPPVLERLRALEPDVFLVVSYGEILRPEFLAIPRRVSLNVHPSLLPRHRGATPIQAALLAGDEVTGVAIQKVAAELDAGDLLLSRATPIGPLETAGELAARLAQWSSELVLEALALVESGEDRYTPQDASQATRCRKLEKRHGLLDWTLPASELERRVRAMNPWPGAITRLPNGADLTVWRARALPAGSAGEDPGAVLVCDQSLVVAAGSGALELLEVQSPGKRPLAANEFLRGARLSAGVRLGGA